MLKPLTPTLREKKRYLVVRTEKSEAELKAILLAFLGELGYAKAGPMVIEKKNSYAIISVVRACLDEVRTAFALQGICCLGVSGTLKKARTKFVKK